MKRQSYNGGMRSEANGWIYFSGTARSYIGGVMDNNVHMQNTLRFAYELQVGKSFRLMLYERSRHGVPDPALVKHMRRMMGDFITDVLPRRSDASTATSARP